MRSLSTRPEFSPTKEGAGFLIGPCKGHRRNNENLMYGNIGVIDADSTLLPDGKIETGAPPYQEVHAALKKANLTHCIYTTYSHGSNKGNRYRIVFPLISRNKIELFAGLSLITEYLQGVCGIPIALTRESHTWAQMWQFPRLSSKDAEYGFVHHDGGVEIHAVEAAKYLGLYTSEGVPAKSKIPPPQKVSKHLHDEEDETRPSVIRMFNRAVCTLTLLADYGYELVSQQTIIGETGEPELSYRFRRPGSTNQPGVIAFVDPFNVSNKGEPCYRVYSHHRGTDPLANDHTNDAFGCMMLLDGIPANKAVLKAATIVQASIDKYLGEQYPGIVDKAFRVLNRCFAGSKVYYNQLDWNAFTMLTVNGEPVPTIEKTANGERYVKYVSVPDYWKTSKARITYSDYVFQPYPAGEEHSFHYEDNGTLKFNTFHGWAERPRKGSWKLLEEHLFRTICGGNTREYEYLLDWFSHLFCRPHEKPGVALVIKGGKGWGKSSVFHRIKEAIGFNATVLSHSEQLVGKFNAHIRDSLLIIAEEAFFHGNKRDASALKHLITDQHTMTEAKGRDAKHTISMSRVIMVTNEELVVEATADERRYFVPSVCDWSYRKDIVNGEKGNFFPALFDEMDNGGIAAFMYDMVKRDTTLRKIVNVPNTHGLSEQRVQSMDSTMSWLYRVLRDGQFEANERVYLWTESGMQCKEKDLLRAVRLEVSSHERTRNYGYTVLAKIKGALNTSVSIQSGSLIFAPLSQCRKEFTESLMIPIESFDEAVVGLENIQESSNISVFHAKTRLG